MTIRDPGRVLDWEGAYNARDLGGYATEDGRETQWGRIIRSDNLIRLTATGRRALQDHGIRTIIDLRLPQELEIDPPPFREHESIQYQMVSFIHPDAATGELPPVETLADDYMRMLNRFGERVGMIMSAIANAREGGVLIHCHSGKDRTGLVSALLLRLAGVPIATAGEDYGLTSELLRPLDEEWLENGPGDRAEREADYARWHARAEVMVEVLERLEAEYGSVEQFLLYAGETPEEIQRLRARLLNREPA